MKTIRGSKDSECEIAVPHNLVRLCRRRQEFFVIINEAIRTAPPWKEDLIDRVINYILAKGVSPISVYNAATQDPFDQGHALGVIAEGIAGAEFHPNAATRKTGCTRGTLLIPVMYLQTTVSIKHTPQNNLNFYPANNGHFDLDFQDARALAKVILDGIHSNGLTWVFLGFTTGHFFSTKW